MEAVLCVGGENAEEVEAVSGWVCRSLQWYALRMASHEVSSATPRTLRAVSTNILTSCERVEVCRSVLFLHILFIFFEKFIM